MPDDFVEMPMILGIRKAGRCPAGAQGNEADDLPATLAVKGGQRAASGNRFKRIKGYCQLLSPTIRIRDYFQTLAGRAVHCQRSLASRLSNCRLLGLAGISSSKVRALAGIGPKSHFSC